MPFCYGINQPLIPPVLIQALFDFSVRSTCALKIAFVYDYDVGKIEHDDFLQLQPAAVIRIHYEYSLVDNPIFLKRHGLLTSAHSFDDHVIESRPGE